MGKVKNKNYINIQGWMVTDLKLKGNDLLIYAIIYGFTQDGEQWFEGSRQYLAEWCNSTKQGVSKNLNSLVGKGYLLKEDIVVNNVKFCKYRANLKFLSADNKVEGEEQSSLPPSKQSCLPPGKQSCLPPGKQSCLPPGKQSLPNNTSLNNTSLNNKESIREKDSVDYQGVIDVYNETCVSLPSVQKLTDKRKRALKSITKKFSVENLKTVFKKAEESSFLNGSSDKWSGATFDWLIKEDNIVKVLEGNYDDKVSRRKASYDLDAYEKDNLKEIINDFNELNNKDSKRKGLFTIEAREVE